MSVVREGERTAKSEPRTARIAARILELPASPTIAVAKEAQALRARGVDVVDFGPGEPDFDTPAHVRAAAAEALERGLTHYPPSRGLPELREAIAAKLQRENGLDYDPAAEIVVTPGAKQAILEAVVTVAQAGDEVITFDPGWGSYGAIIQLAGATPVHVPLWDACALDVGALEGALSSRTRAMIVASPANPTGHVLDEAELKVIADVCRERELVLISDEIYERIVYDGARAVSPATLPDMRERTVTINGFSKAYAMTGWRLGYYAAPAGLVAQMLKVHEHTVTAATSFAQAGAVQALEGPQDSITAMVDEFARRRAIVVDGLNRLPGIRCPSPDGAFYVFPDISGTGLSGTDLAHRLLQHGVAVTPGCGFGDGWDGHIRMSYATSEERIHTGLARMGEALTS